MPRIGFHVPCMDATRGGAIAVDWGVADSGETVDDVTSMATEAAAPPAIVLVATEHAIVHHVVPVGARPVPLGRVGAVTSGLELDDERVSRQHAEVTRRGRGWIVRDLGSRNGTFVDGERITDEVAVTGDRVVRVGHSVLLLLEHGGEQRDRAPDDGDAVIGPELARIYGDIRRHGAAPTLLVHGASGTGKELAARLYHQSGPRAAGPFVPVNCAAIPEGVAERLLFGARKGAFSGATDAVGWVQSAHGGTLFLDEIAELDAGVQAKLLRVLESREVVPVGASSGIKVELGVVAATHRDLRAAVSERAFRDDLYYRLARPMVDLPALHSRKADIPRLVRRALAEVDRGLTAHAKLIEACCVRRGRQRARAAARAARRRDRRARRRPRGGAPRGSARPRRRRRAPGAPAHDQPAAGHARRGGIERALARRAGRRAGRRQRQRQRRRARPRPAPHAAVPPARATRPARHRRLTPPALTRVSTRRAAQA